MSDIGCPAGLDLRSGDLRVAVRTADGAVRTTSVPAAAALVDGRLVYGRAAADALVLQPAAGWSDLLDRVGDPVPIRLGAQAVPAADLVARAVAGCLEGSASALNILSPDGWGAGRRRRLAAALVAAGLPTPRWVDAVEVLAPAPDASAGDGRVLLLTTGPRATTARVLSPTADGWRTDAVHQVDFGSDDVREATFALASANIVEGAGRPLTPAEARILGAVCAHSADRLPAARRLDLNLPGLPAARVTRADVEDALAPRLTAAFAGLPAALAAQGVAALPQRVLIEGSGTRLSVVADVVSATLGRPVEGIVSEAAAALTSPAFAEAGVVEAAVASPATVHMAPAPVTELLPPAWIAAAEHAPRGRPWLRPAVAGVLLLGLLAGVAFAARGPIRDAIAGLTRPGAAAIPATVATTPVATAPSESATPTATTIPPETPSPSAPPPTSTKTSTSTKTTTKPKTTTTKKVTSTTTTTTTDTTTTTSDTTSTSTTTDTAPATTTTDPVASP